MAKWKDNPPPVGGPDDFKCPACGGGVWDNRDKKESGAYKPNAADFACKDKEDCGWAYVGPVAGQSAAPEPDGPSPSQPQVGDPGSPGSPLYLPRLTLTMYDAYQAASAMAKADAIGQNDVRDVAIALFRAHLRHGRPISQEEKPAPPPPPPPPPADEGLPF